MIKSNARIFFGFFLLLLSANLAFANELTNGFISIPDQNLESPHVRSIAEFAIKEYFRDDNVVLGQVFEGQKQRVAGTNYIIYKLSIQTRVLASHPMLIIKGQFRAIVIEGLPSPNAPLMLVSAEPISMEFMPVSVDDPQVRSIAEFAVKEYNAKSGEGIELVKVESASRQVVALGNGFFFELLITTKTKDGVFQGYRVVASKGFPNSFNPGMTLFEFKPTFNPVRDA